MFRRAWKVELQKFCPLCCKQVTALNPHRIVFSKFLQIALIVQFYENFENIGMRQPHVISMCRDHSKWQSHAPIVYILSNHTHYA